MDKYHLDWPGIYLVAMVTVGFGLYQLVNRMLDQKHTTFYITNWRVVIQNNNAIVPIKTIDHGTITLIDLEVSPFERRVNACAVVIYTDEIKQNDDHEEQVYYLLEAVESPQEVLRIL